MLSPGEIACGDSASASLFVQSRNFVARP